LIGTFHSSEVHRNSVTIGRTIRHLTRITLIIMFIALNSTKEENVLIDQ